MGGGWGAEGAPLSYQKCSIKTTSYVKQSVFDFCLQLQSCRSEKTFTSYIKREIQLDISLPSHTGTAKKDT